MVCTNLKCIRNRISLWLMFCPITKYCISYKNKEKEFHIGHRESQACKKQQFLNVRLFFNKPSFIPLTHVIFLFSIPPAFSLKPPSMPAGKRMFSMKNVVFRCLGNGQQYKVHGCEQHFPIVGAEMPAGVGAEVLPHLPLTAQSQKERSPG